jgi:hypothetical protein
MVYVIPLGGFVRACFYKSNHKSSCCLRVREVGHFEKLALVGICGSSSMAWDVWIHACSHGFLG